MDKPSLSDFKRHPGLQIRYIVLMMSLGTLTTPIVMFHHALCTRLFSGLLPHGSKMPAISPVIMTSDH